MRRFGDRIAIVTGGAQGIGRAVSHRLASEGATVVAADIDGDAARATADELTARLAEDVTATPGTVEAVRCDVTDRCSVEAAIAEVVDRHGRLDVLVNNVGVNGGPPFPEIDDDEWIRQSDPTLLGAVRCIQAALPYLKVARGGGAVVSVGSVNGLAAFGSIPYSAAKAGLINLTENLALRYGRNGVRVNVVAPGTVRTGAWNDVLDHDPEVHDRLSTLYPLGRVGEPSDIAAAVAFLASDDAAWITGTTLRVDGGVLAGVPGFFDAVRGTDETDVDP